MSFKVWLKAKAADRALSPLRKELIDLFDQNSSVLDIGCGTGDLLHRASSKISFGCGIDLDAPMIDYAKKKSGELNISNLLFKCLDSLNMSMETFDIATSTLCLHEMRPKVAHQVLQKMAQHSKRILIADYSKPKSTLARASIECDELFSGHYSQFKEYRASGEIPEYARHCGLKINAVVESAIDGVLIWDIEGNSGSPLLGAEK